MKNIRDHILEFSRALTKNDQVVLHPSGEWEIKQTYFTFMGQSYSQKNIEQLLKMFNKQMDALEKHPILFPLRTKMALVQPINYAGFIEAAWALVDRFGDVTLGKVEALIDGLRRRILGLQYRLESLNGGFGRGALDRKLFDQFLTAAKEWKKTLHIYETDELSPLEIRKIEELCGYGEFAEFLFYNDNLLKEFFLWALRDKNSVAVFVEFPALQETLSRCGLQQRLGRFDGIALKLNKVPVSSHENVNVAHKIVTLPFEGRELSILDESKMVTFQGNYKLSIREVFEIFYNKFKKVGNLEFFSQGIVNWNAHKLGWWDEVGGTYHTIDLYQNEWWNQLPLFETITPEEAEQRYGIRVDEDRWVVAATATRGASTLDFENTHAFFEIAIPQASGQYRIFNFGKFGVYFPTTFFENLTTFAETMHATVAYPDENVFYSHRQTAYFPFLFERQEGLALMDAIKRDIFLAREANFVYQIESENCAKWTHEILVETLGAERVPNLYKMSLLDTEPTGIVSKIFNMIKKLPKDFQVGMLTAIHFPLGAWKGREIKENGNVVRKNLIRHNFWNTAEVYLPAFLSHQKETGALSVGTVKVEDTGFLRRAGKLLERFVG
jgi:hypothetical protein